MQILYKYICAPLYFIQLDTQFLMMTTRLRDQNSGYYVNAKWLFHEFTSLSKVQPEKKEKQIIWEIAIHMHY